jgi:L-alanine-DL-glutamate epimerase-like enolase superfamily enzyme
MMMQRRYGLSCSTQSHGVTRANLIGRCAGGIDALGTVVCEVELTSGIVGVGISIGGNPACYVIEEHLSRFVEGQDVHNIELMWDQMYRVRCTQSTPRT